MASRNYSSFQNYKKTLERLNAVAASSFKNGHTQDEGRITFNLNLQVNIHHSTSRFSQLTRIFILIQILKEFYKLQSANDHGVCEGPCVPNTRELPTCNNFTILHGQLMALSCEGKLKTSNLGGDAGISFSICSFRFSSSIIKRFKCVLIHKWAVPF